jgi:hypothetical protein
MNTVTLILGLALVTPLGFAADEGIGQGLVRDTGRVPAATDTRNGAAVRAPQLARIAQARFPRDGDDLPVAGCGRDMRHSDAQSEAAPSGFGYMLVDPSGWLPNSEKRHA